MEYKKLTKTELCEYFLSQDVRYCKDRVSEVELTIRRLMNKDGQNALLWLVKFLILTHPNPRPVIQHTAELLDVYKNQWKLISTIFETVLEM